jgi:hypothetical protein
MTTKLRIGDRVYMAGKGFGDGTIRETGWDGEGGEQIMAIVEWDCSPGYASASFVRNLRRSEEVSMSQANEDAI